MDITIKFIGFWSTFNIHDNIFVKTLSQCHNVTVLEKGNVQTPDILFYSRYSNGAHLKPDCIKVYYTGENDFPNFNECDYALSFYNFEYLDRHLRYPLYKFYEYDQLERPLVINDSDAVNRNFCSLLMRNYYNCDSKRIEIIDAVESYKKVSYGGPFRNNVGGCVEEKIPFIHNYKFNLALENSDIDGYVTEKILEPFVAATVPIYWGTDCVSKDFNPDAFINVRDFDNLHNLIDFIKRLDNDASEYLKMLRAPKLISGSSPDFDSMLLDFLNNIVINRKKYVHPHGEINVLNSRNTLMWQMYNSKFLRLYTKAMRKMGLSK
ncbi:MAG: glycosyltransferase [Bacteroides sp.]|nr:glycosyltransferase [Bacteroides sp.]